MQSTPRPWAVVQFTPEGGPGSLATITAERRIPLIVHRVGRGEPLPDLAEIGALIVLGDPGSRTDRDGGRSRLDIIALLRAAVADDVPVLAIGLGAQLLATACGGEIEPGDGEEVGAGSVMLTDIGCTDAVLGAFTSPLSVFHWHRSTFTLPPRAVHLAMSAFYDRQAFRVGRLAYGVQFHIEIDPDLAHEWAHLLPGPERLTRARVRELLAAGRVIIAAFAALVLAHEAWVERTGAAPRPAAPDA